MAATAIPSAPPRRFWRSAWAIVAGFLFVVILSIATDLVLYKFGVFPPPGQYTPDKPLALATLYRVIYGVIGSYITARLAPNRPMFHAILGGCIGMAIGVVGAFTQWNNNFGPHWYPIALVVLALPQSWLGAKLFLRNQSALP
ncbi:MAG TPA: hypothetical protein VMJ35_09975 [Dongiaceae bacterium]|nr:hypothetical protein [Dongiaceae bacterium]